MEEKESTSVTASGSNDSINIIEISPEEKINIKKKIKYKELNGKYIKGEILGSGAFAKVRECIDKTSLKRYAVKIMKKHFIKKNRLNVEKEIQLVWKLNHKNVMKMIDSFSTDKKIYIIMEYCAGILTDIIECAPDQRLPIWQTHHYFYQLIDGLKYLHSKGIYHRDIKEDNLLIDNSHVIKIADFGVSYVLDLFAEDDFISGYSGSPLYRPPDILDDKYSGSKFDIWSSGVVLFKMVSGSYPFFNKQEDLFDKKSYHNLQYPKVIEKDRQLLDLLKNILNVNFNDRITIKEIKSHPWVQLKHKNESDVRVEFPPLKFGDIYRGMTLLERLRVKFEFNYELNADIQWVNQQEYEESIEPKQPNVRSNRSPVKREIIQKLSPSQRLNQMGLDSLTDNS